MFVIRIVDWVGKDGDLIGEKDHSVLGSSNFPFFPNLKTPSHPGGGGSQENRGLFPLFVTLLV